mmetsp:Transcript_71537/g.232486  ORF Transcript_71537/g.232486 Transcript_71537/m.232486 type:complete len:215 (-) Transcript_71537:2320-2964(-)
MVAHMSFLTTSSTASMRPLPLLNVLNCWVTSRDMRTEAKRSTESTHEPKMINRDSWSNPLRRSNSMMKRMATKDACEIQCNACTPAARSSCMCVMMRSFSPVGPPPSLPKAKKTCSLRYWVVLDIREPKSGMGTQTTAMLFAVAWYMAFQLTKSAAPADSSSSDASSSFSPFCSSGSYQSCRMPHMYVRDVQVVQTPKDTAKPMNGRMASRKKG